MEINNLNLKLIENKLKVSRSVNKYLATSSLNVSATIEFRICLCDAGMKNMLIGIMFQSGCKNCLIAKEIN